MAISGDSGEYEFLHEAVELSKDVEGMLCEVGLRAGMGTKTIIDAACQFRPGSTIVSIDPYGSLIYEARQDQFCRLDYTDDMMKQCMTDLWAYTIGKDVKWLPFKMTDEYFFQTFWAGIETYDLEIEQKTKYSFVHLDGPHGELALNKEIRWFNKWMDEGAIMAIDDITIDFIDIKPIDELFDLLGWIPLKKGLKKGLWQKI